jgi:hypothetical protein
MKHTTKRTIINCSLNQPNVKIVSRKIRQLQTFITHSFCTQILSLSTCHKAYEVPYNFGINSFLRFHLEIC